MCDVNNNKNKDWERNTSFFYSLRSTKGKTLKVPSRIRLLESSFNYFFYISYFFFQPLSASCRILAGFLQDSLGDSGCKEVKDGRLQMGSDKRAMWRSVTWEGFQGLTTWVDDDDEDEDEDEDVDVDVDDAVAAAWTPRLWKWLLLWFKLNVAKSPSAMWNKKKKKKINKLNWFLYYFYFFFFRWDHNSLAIACHS